MLCKVRGWVCRHKKGLGITAAVTAAAGYGAYRYAASYFDALQKEHLETMQEIEKKNFFRAIAFRGPVLAELASLRENISETIGLPTNEEVKQRGSEGSKEQKLAFWNELSLLNFTRLLTSLYSVSLLSVSLRMHMTVIARFLYMDQMMNNEASHPELALSTQTRLDYLNKARYMAHTGVQHLRNTVQSSCEDILHQYAWLPSCFASFSLLTRL